MPNLKNAKKALRQSKARAEENKKFKDAYKHALKAVRKAMEAGETKLDDKVVTAQKSLGKAVKKGILKQNNAARKLSRMMAKVNAVAKK